MTTLPPDSDRAVYRWHRATAPAWERRIFDRLAADGFHVVARMEALLWARANGTLDACPIFDGAEGLRAECNALLPPPAPTLHLYDSGEIALWDADGAFVRWVRDEYDCPENLWSELARLEAERGDGRRAARDYGDEGAYLYGRR